MDGTVIRVSSGLGDSCTANSPLRDALAVQRLDHLDKVDILEEKCSTELVSNSLARVWVENGGACERLLDHAKEVRILAQFTIHGSQVVDTIVVAAYVGPAPSGSSERHLVILLELLLGKEAVSSMLKKDSLHMLSTKCATERVWRKCR